MAYLVVAPLVVARLDTGAYAYLYERAELPDNLADGEPGRLADGGFVSEVADPEPDAPVDRTLNDHTVAELDALAKAENVDLAGARNKADKVAAIQASRAAAAFAPHEGSEGGSDI